MSVILPPPRNDAKQYADGCSAGAASMPTGYETDFLPGASAGSKEAGEGLEVAARGAVRVRVREGGVDLFADDEAARLGDRRFDRRELLRQFEAGTLAFDHVERRVQVAGGALEAFRDGGAWGLNKLGHMHSVTEAYAGMTLRANTLCMILGAGATLLS